VRKLLAERGLAPLRALADAPLSESIGARAAAVLCFGPGCSASQVRAALDALARDAPRAACLSIILAGTPDLDGFQGLIDSDHLFFLARGPLADQELVALVESAAETLERRARPRGADPSERSVTADSLRRLAAAQGPAELAGEIAALVARVVGAHRARCILFDTERQALWVLGADPEARESAAVGLASFVFHTGRALCLPAIGGDPRFDRELDDPDGEASDRFLAVPVRAAGGEVVAVLSALRSALVPPFAPPEVAALRGVAAHVAPFLALQPARSAAADEPPAEATPRSPFRGPALRALERPSAGVAGLLLARLSSGRRRVRYVPQAAAADCGAACLAMTLGWHGKTVSLEDVHRVTGSTRHGLDGHTLLRAGEHFGLRGRGVQLREPEDLALLDPGSILHWGFNHFVVLEQAERRGAWVLDPGFGRRFVSRAELDRALTGVALTFEPGPDFEPGGQKSPLLGRYLRRVLRHNAALARVLLASVLLQLGALAVPLLTGLLVDRVIPRGDHELFWAMAGGAAALAGFTLAVTLLRTRILLALRTRLDAQLSLDFLQHLVRLPFAFFQQRSAGDLLMRLSSNSMIREILTSTVLSGALDGLMVVSYLALLLVVDVRLGLLVAALAIVRVAILGAGASPPKHSKRRRRPRAIRCSSSPASRRSRPAAPRYVRSTPGRASSCASSTPRWPAGASTPWSTLSSTVSPWLRPSPSCSTAAHASWRET
jgi:hypothetical protein